MCVIAVVVVVPCDHCYSKNFTLTRRFNLEAFNSNPMLL
jgi:hypothetical protein